jgi:hypothetical protein
VTTHPPIKQPRKVKGKIDKRVNQRLNDYAGFIKSVKNPKAFTRPGSRNPKRAGGK